MRYAIIEPGRQKTGVEWLKDALPQPARLEDFRRLLQTLFAGDGFEHVVVNTTAGQSSMFIGERSTQQELPHNDLATLLYQTTGKTSTIHGRAVLFDGKVWP